MIPSAASVMNQGAKIAKQASKGFLKTVAGKVTMTVAGLAAIGSIGTGIFLGANALQEKRTAPTPAPEQQVQATATETPTATPEPTQEVVPTQEAEAATVAPTQQATPEPTPEVVVQEQNEAAASDAGADTGSGDYVIPDSSTRYLTNADLNGLSEWQIRIARNEIYARHGRIFKSDDLADYFASKSWYTPSVSADQFDNSYLNSIEIENLKLITAYEKAHNLNQ